MLTLPTPLSYKEVDWINDIQDCIVNNRASLAVCGLIDFT